ncbi:MAG: ATP-binding protein [Alphaproteobacteria bacterium]|nr:ATP-binding protein [Alphaproteobacteria bacterium]
MKYFNIAGPCLPDRHYMLPPEGRLPELDRLVDKGAFFVVHAPRQTGKTTAMKALAKRLTAEGRYAGLYVSCERARVFQDVGLAEQAIWTAVIGAANEGLPPPLRPPEVPKRGVGSQLREALAAWADACALPVVLVLDEIDALPGDALSSVLSQLRDGYVHRPSPFPHTVILCGMRDVRDYKTASGGGPVRVGSASPFNIKEASLRLDNFSEADLRALYAQHTAETGQVFTEEALALAWQLTRGQPWLVNALAREVVEVMAVPADVPVTAEHMATAKERLILARATHLDSLLARLREDRVRRVLEPVIAGELIDSPSFDDDFQYVVDLGLVEPRPPVRIANPIYREVILRVLASPAEANVVEEARDHLGPDGLLDMRRLLERFLEFWSQHSEALLRGMPYPEAAPQLVLMAWLHRVVNGGGSIEREVGVGRGRIDLLLRWPHTVDGVRHWQAEAVEIKVWRDRDKKRDPTDSGLKQLDGYLSRLGLTRGWLVIFDVRSAAPEIEERLSIEDIALDSGRHAVVVRA